MGQHLAERPCGVVEKSWTLLSARHEFQSRLWLYVQPWANSLFFLRARFLMCKMRLILPSSQNFVRINWKKQCKIGWHWLLHWLTCSRYSKMSIFPFYQYLFVDTQEISNLSQFFFFYFLLQNFCLDFHISSLYQIMNSS